ncbi:MAG: hypothetical protein RL346_1467 [Verrucomicrobiota bacterium]|jgi:uncharacterized protein (DUF433 family)
MQAIESRPDIMMGKPVIAGTRISVDHIVEALAAGESFDQISSRHPRLTRDSILAAIDFGAKALKAVVVCPLPEHAA